MNRLIARLIDFGMTRDVAVCMMRQYRGRPQAEIWPLMDEMMDTIHAIHPRLYSAVMDRLRG